MASKANLPFGPSGQGAPRWLMPVAAGSILWGMMGCVACWAQVTMSAETLAAMDPADRALFVGMPGWYNPVYAVAVGSGLAGGIALLLRRKLAEPLFALSLAAVVVQFGYLFATSDIIARKGFIGAAAFPIVIALVALGELLVARTGRRQGWLR